MRSASITGVEKPASTNWSPKSCMSTKGSVCGVSSSAANAVRSSLKVSGPKFENINSPSTRSTRRHSANTRSGWGCQCSARFDHTRSIEFGPNGRVPKSPQRRSTPALAGIRRLSIWFSERIAGAGDFGAGQHGGGSVDADDLGGRIGFLQGAEVGTGAAAGVEHALGHDFHQAQPFVHALGDLAAQEVGRGHALRFREQRAHAPGVNRRAHFRWGRGRIHGSVALK